MLQLQSLPPLPLLAKTRETKAMALFSSRFGTPESDLRATAEHCSAFCFLVKKIIQKLVN
jgi:hypothetical protein